MGRAGEFEALEGMIGELYLSQFKSVCHAIFIVNMLLFMETFCTFALTTKNYG